MGKMREIYSQPERANSTGNVKMNQPRAIPLGRGERQIEPPRAITLPTISILNTDFDIDPADLKAGLSAARAAGLS